MNEAEWLVCTDPRTMIVFLDHRLGDRKLRLFVCACGRWVWELLGNRASEGAIEVAERFADGDASADELGAAFIAAVDAADLEILEPAVFNARSAAMIAATQKLNMGDACAASSYAVRAEPKKGNAEEPPRFLRDLIPTPFRRVILDPRCLSPKVAALTRTIFEDRAFDIMPVLGDALEEAGCHNADILGHCRQPGQHVRGCWAVDLLLGKE